MAQFNPQITVQYEPQIVKVTCLNIDCVHNLFNRASDPEAACNLKRMVIDTSGRCKDMMLKSPKDGHSDVSE